MVIYFEKEIHKININIFNLFVLSYMSMYLPEKLIKGNETFVITSIDHKRAEYIEGNCL